MWNSYILNIPKRFLLAVISFPEETDLGHTRIFSRCSKNETRSSLLLYWAAQYQSVGDSKAVEAILRRWKTDRFVHAFVNTCKPSFKLFWQSFDVKIFDSPDTDFIIYLFFI